MCVHLCSKRTSQYITFNWRSKTIWFNVYTCKKGFVCTFCPVLCPHSTQHNRAGLPNAFSTQLGPNLKTTEFFLGDFCCLQQSLGQGLLGTVCHCLPWLISEVSQGDSLSLCFFIYYSSSSHCRKVLRALGEQMVQIWAVEALGKKTQMCKYLLCKIEGFWGQH